MNSPHPTRFIDELNADIDVDVFPLVETINEMGFETISSCQGTPGVIGEGGFYGHVAFQHSNYFEYEGVCAFAFVTLRRLFESMYDHVRFEVTLSEDTGYTGWIHFRNEVLDEVSRKLNTYRNMEGK